MKNEDIVILIISDSEEDSDLIVDQISAQYGNYHQAFEIEEAIALFDEHTPKLIFVAYDNLEYAERCYLALYRNSAKINKVAHQIILMCPAPESLKACSLCMGDIFDDYIVYKPAYDIHRINLSIVHAIKRLNADSKQAVEKFAPYSDVAESMHESIKASISHGHEARNVSQSTYQNLRESLGAHLDELGQHLTKGNVHKRLDIKDPALLEQLLKQFGKDKLMPEVNHAHQEIEQVLNDLVQSREADYAEFEEPVKQITDLVAGEAKTILMIDDDDMFLSIMTNTIEPEGYNVLTATDAKQGLKTMLEHRPDLVLVDLNMPGRNGIEFIQTAKSQAVLVHTPIIMVTGDSHKSTLTTVLKAGACDFIVKPAEREVLLSKIDRHVH